MLWWAMRQLKSGETMFTPKLKTLSLVILLALFGCSTNQQTAQTNAPNARTTTKSVAADPIPDLPDYPGATRTAYSAKGRTVEVEYTTGDPFDKVTAFYTKALKDNGWNMGSLTSSAASASDYGVTFTASKNGADVKIVVAHKPEGNVAITVERK